MILSKLITALGVCNIPKVESFKNQNQSEMKTEGKIETGELRRKLAQLKHEGLEGMDYVRSKIFTSCETVDCGSYVCNLSTGSIEESHGMARILGASNKCLSVAEIDGLTHPADRSKIHEILEALVELGKVKLITSQDRLSCIYRLKVQDRYILVNRKSGLAIKKSTREILNWSNIYAMSNLTPLDHVRSKWTGKNFGHAELTDQINKKGSQILSRRENEVLSVINRGLNSRETAEALHISRETVKKHLSNMFKKTGTRNRIQLLKYFERNSKR